MREHKKGALTIEANIDYVYQKQSPPSTGPLGGYASLDAAMTTLARNQRHEAIRRLLAERGRAAVDELAEVLHVTTMTIRRDLALLEEAGVLTRTHGGCALATPFVHEAPFEEKDRRQRAQKAAIACRASETVSTGATLFLDTGTTAVHFARALPTDAGFRVFTNNLRVAMALFGRRDVEVTVLGGRLTGGSPDLVGEVGLRSIQDFRFDVAVIGADAVDVGRGEFYSADHHTAALSQSAQRQASKTLLLVDSSKFGKHAHFVAGRLDASITLVTDSGVEPKDSQRLVASGIELICVAPTGARCAPNGRIV